MAENQKPPTDNSCESKNIVAPQNPLEDERLKVAKAVISVLDDSENVWRTVSEKQTMLHRIYAEQIIVSDKFTEYNLTWRDRDYTVSANVESFHQFTEIDEQVQVLLQFLDEFELKTKRAGDILKGFIRDMKTHIASLKSSLELVSGAKSVEDLANVPIPSLDWIHTIQDPGIELLMDDWDQMQLNPRITHFLQQLQQLVHPDLQNEEPILQNDNH